MCEATVCRTIKTVCSILCSMAKDIIQWPKAEEQGEIKNNFEAMKGFPGVIGAIDGTHIPITCSSNFKESYMNRKKFSSVQLQIVVDDKCQIRDAFTGVPGSRHDSAVFNMSELGDKFHNAPDSLFFSDCHLIGDKAYSLSSYLLTPFRFNAPLSPAQVWFNKCHSGTRMVVERAIGLLKGRFRRLQHKLEVESMASVVEVVIAACVLHNICL